DVLIMLGTQGNKIVHVRYAASALILTRLLPSTSQLSPKVSTLSSCFLKQPLLVVESGVQLPNLCIKQVDREVYLWIALGSRRRAGVRRCSVSTRRRTSTIGFARHGVEALAPTGRQAKADEAGGFLVPLLLLLLVVVVGGR